MLTMLKRILGLVTGTADDAEGPGRKARRPSATGHLFAKDSPALRRSPAASKPRPGAKPAPPKSSGRAEFDPYNTGKFDRGASWEKISKSQR